MRRALILLVVAACGSKEAPPADKAAPPAGSGSGSAKAQLSPNKRNVEQIPPPADLAKPPADATTLPDGLVYKKLTTTDGPSPKKNDGVILNYTGWKQTSGETFFTTKTRGQPNSMSLSTTAPGFQEAVLMMHKGERLLAWIPPSLTTGGTAKSKGDTLVYEFELIDVMSAPEVPADVAGPPANAQELKPAGVKYVVLKPGDGKDKPRAWDNVSFEITGWEASGRMFDTTEMRKRPAVAPPFKESELLAQILVTMTSGERIRFWTDADRMALDGRPPPGLPKGQLCYELQLVRFDKAAADPPPVPPDVAKPPDDAVKTPKGAFYKVLKKGTGGHPQPTDAVKMHLTGWHTDGRMFDTTVTHKQPALIQVSSLPGWVEVLPLLSLGDKARVWLPAELAYKNAPNKPQGMLVFDIELFDLKPK